jgi:hypothetical protein
MCLKSICADVEGAKDARGLSGKPWRAHMEEFLEVARVPTIEGFEDKNAVPKQFDPNDRERQV